MEYWSDGVVECERSIFCYLWLGIRVREDLSAVSQKFEDDDEMRVLVRKQHSEER
jgi:hypothetical protein